MLSGQDFVMYERTYAPGFHDLIFGILRDARIVPNVSQTAAEISTLISLVVAHMGIAILPASAVKHKRRFGNRLSHCRPDTDV